MTPPGPPIDPRFALLLERPSRSGLFCDFDGTLAPIVDDPAAATATAGAGMALGRLASRWAAVWVVSGRPVEFLARQLPAEVGLSGLYGLETRIDGVARIDPRAERWSAVVDQVAGAAEAASGADVAVERKGLAVTLHFRVHPEAAPRAEALARQLADDSGLTVHAGRMSYELRPPVQVDKGTVVQTAAAGLAAVCFLGDDRGDLPAFDALDRLAAGGVHAVRVAVASAEAPSELLERADVVLDGPPAVVALIEALSADVAG